MSQHISSVDKLASKIKTVIFDCDGVLWLMDQKIEGATEIVQYLHDQNIRVFFVSNNSTKTTTQYLEKFKKLDFNMDIIDESQVISAARITAKCLANKGVKKAFVIGGKAIDAEMAREGVQAVRHEEELSKCEPQKIDFELDPEVTAVVAGMDINIQSTDLLKWFKMTFPVPDRLSSTSSEHTKNIEVSDTTTSTTHSAEYSTTVCPPSLKRKSSANDTYIDLTTAECDSATTQDSETEYEQVPADFWKMTTTQRNGWKRKRRRQSRMAYTQAIENRKENTEINFSNDSMDSYRVETKF